MFYGCTSLTTAPVLPASTLVEKCYAAMFGGCSNLKSVTCLATDISAEDCITDWLNGVATGGTFYKASGMSGWASKIPGSWSVENYVAP